MLYKKRMERQLAAARGQLQVEKPPDEVRVGCASLLHMPMTGRQLLHLPGHRLIMHVGRF